jgi:putative transposase
MILGHTIALDETPNQAAYFRRANGTARYAYNWGLAEWQRMRDAGEKPSMAAIKKRWNAHRKAELPWSYEVTKCASGQAIMDLGAAFSNFLRDCKKPRNQRRFKYPRFKRKALNESFALWNDQFTMCGNHVRIAKLGTVRMREHLRFAGKIMGAVVSFSGGRWFLSVQVDTDGDRPSAPIGTVAGVDLGVTTLATVSSGGIIEKLDGPRPRNRLLGRIKRLARRVSKQKHRAKKAGIKASRRQYIRQLRLSKLHARLANIRKDAAHKLTTGLTRRFETIVIEDLNVSGMAKNHGLAGSVLDCGFHEIRRQFQYKAAMRGGRIVFANRFFPSSKTCSSPGCGVVNDAVVLGVDTWTCGACGTVHDRDSNAATNLENLGRATADETRGDMAPLSVCTSMPASAADEPRTETERTCAHI